MPTNDEQAIFPKSPNNALNYRTVFTDANPSLLVARESQAHITVAPDHRSQRKAFSTTALAAW